MAVNGEQRSGADAASAHASGAQPVKSTDVGPRHASLADTLPPTPLKTLLSTGGADLFVLSTDANLVATVQRAAGEQFPVITVASWDELETAVAAGRCGIALIDADALGRRLHARLAELERYSSRLVILVAADRSAAEGLMGLLAESKIHRLLIKPPALGITRLLIESGVNRYLRLREAGSEPTPAPAAVVRPPPRVAPVRRHRVPLWVLAAAGAALLAGVAVIVGISAWWRSPAAPDVAAVSPESSSAPAGAELDATQGFDALVARADEALRDGRLAEPPGDNALDYYLAVLAADPAHVGARSKLDTALNDLFARAESALLADDRDAASSALAHVRRADPESGRLAFLEAQLERAADLADDAAARDAARLEQLVASARTAARSGDVNAATAAVAEARSLGADERTLASLNAQLAAARAARVRQRNAESLELAESRLRAGNLFAPEGDSAQHYLERLRSEAPGFDGLDDAWAQLRAAAAARAASALAARDWDAAESVLEALANVPDGDAAAAPLRVQLEHGRLQEQYLAIASPASELTLIESVAPEYPRDAARRDIEGWVDVEFIVDPAGRPRALTVVGAEPPGRFEEATLAAIREYRYEPFERDGKVFERLVRLRTRFTLEGR